MKKQLTGGHVLIVEDLDLTEFFRSYRRYSDSSFRTLTECACGAIGREETTHNKKLCSMGEKNINKRFLKHLGK